MNHSEALRGDCTERYLLGEMADDERLAFEEHFFECRECADDVKAGVALIENARRVLAQEPTLASEETEEAGATAGRPPARSTRRGPRVGRAGTWRPMVMRGALAAALLVAIFQGLVVIPELRQELARARSPQVVSWEFLSVARSEPPTLTVGAEDLFLGLRLSRSTAGVEGELGFTLRDGEGRAVRSASLRSPRPDDELALVLPVEGLAAGSYSIVLSSGDSGAGSAGVELARYEFVLARDGESTSTGR